MVIKRFRNECTKKNPLMMTLKKFHNDGAEKVP